MIIRPQPIELEQSDLVDATTHLTEYFDNLVWTYGGFDMYGWRLVFTIPALLDYSGQCCPDEKIVYVNTVSLGRDIQSKRGLEYWRGLVIHEFAHAWGYENYRSAFLHTFPFHCVVSLLLAKFGLGWDKRLYNLCDDQKGRYHYTPAVLFRMCRFLAHGIKDHDTLKSALERLLTHFNTHPKTLGQVRRWMRLEVLDWRRAYMNALSEKSVLVSNARMWERACWVSVAVAALLSVRVLAA